MILGLPHAGLVKYNIARKVAGRRDLNEIGGERSFVLSAKSHFASATAARGRPPRQTFRLPLAPRLFSAFTVAAVAGAAAIMALLAILVALKGEWAFGALFLAPLTGFMAYLASYVANDMQGKWRLRLAFEPDSLVLDLPAGRSLIHHPAAQHLSIPYAEIAAIEFRLEGYRSLGTAMMQRSYVLRRKPGDVIFLFEDRAIGTAYQSSYFPPVVAEIAARAGVPVIDRGMVEGGGGALGLWGAHAPDWATPSLSAARQRKIWRAAKMTGALSIVVLLIALLVRLFIGPL